MNFPTMDSFGFGVTVTDSGGAVATGPLITRTDSQLRLTRVPIPGTLIQPIEPKPELVVQDVVKVSVGSDATQVIRVVGEEGARIYDRGTSESYVQSVIRDVGETGVRIHEAEMDALRRASAADRERMIDLLAERKAQQIIAQARESEMADVGAVIAPVAEPEKKETPWGWIAAAAAAGVYALTQ